MKRLFTIPLAIVLSSAASSAQQAPPVPDLEIEVAVRQKVDGKLEDGVHVLQLTCEHGDCLLVSVTLNQCFLGILSEDRNGWHPEWDAERERGGRGH
jgi:hypothetical protein